MPALRLLLRLALPAVIAPAVVCIGLGAPGSAPLASAAIVYSGHSAPTGAPTTEPRPPDLRAASAPQRSSSRAAPRALRTAARQAATTPAGISARTTRAAAGAFPALRQFAWTTPVQGTYQSSGFGQRWGRLHAGVDFAGAVGTPLRSPSSGIVTFVGAEGGYGNKVEVTCWDGTVVRFGHLAGFSVTEGQRVEPGQRVGRLGNSGRSTGPHLHFEVRPGGGPPVDPEPWLLARAIMPIDTAR